MKHLTSSKHIEQFENKIHDLIDGEHAQLSEALNGEIKSESEEACLWRRYDQLRFMRALLDGKYKYSADKAIMSENETVEFID